MNSLTKNSSVNHEPTIYLLGQSIRSVVSPVNKPTKEIPPKIFQKFTETFKILPKSNLDLDNERETQKIKEKNIGEIYENEIKKHQ